MAYLPDTQEIPGRKKLRAIVAGIGVASGLLAFGFVQNGNGKGFLISAGLAAALIFIATKIKTERKLIGGGGVYR